MISFQTEDMKRAVLAANPCPFSDVIRLYRTDGLYADDKTMSWNGRKLIILEAPEPNGIDWNNIHAKMHDRFIVLVIHIPRVSSNRIFFLPCSC